MDVLFKEYPFETHHHDHTKEDRLYLMVEIWKSEGATENRKKSLKNCPVSREKLKKTCRKKEKAI